MYQAGTLSGNPLAMSCGYALLKELHESPEIYEELEAKTIYFEKGIRQVFDKHGIAYAINRVGSMISFHFTNGKIENFDDACNADADFFKNLFHAVLKRGIYFAPSAFETLFIARTHRTELLDQTIQAIDEGLSEIL